jgi:putative DNA primase/helicase
MEATVTKLPVAPLSKLDEVIAKLHEAKKANLTADEWSIFWPPLVFNLDPVGEAKAIEALVDILGVGKQPLKAMMKAFREQQEQQRQIAAGGVVGGKQDKYATLVKILREDRNLLVQPPRFNLMTQAVELVGASGSSKDLTDAHVSKLREDLGKLGTGFSFGKDDVFDALNQIAHEREYHPVKEYLLGLTWDGIPRLDGVAKEFLGARGDLDAILTRKWFISAVARGLRPGCKVDTAFIPAGGQGIKKSTFFKTLGGEWYRDTSLDLSNKDSYTSLRGAWIYEWPELETMQRARSQNSVKAFLSSQEDYYRPPYGRTMVRVPRSCVIVGTTNDAEFLTDPTGNRRYWPMEVHAKKIDLVKLAADRDQLWAEAVVAFQNDEQWWLTDEEEKRLAEEQAQYVAEDPWQALIKEYVDGDYILPGTKDTKGPKLEFVTTGDLLVKAIGKEGKYQSRADQMKLAGLMLNLGWEKAQPRIEDGRRRGWARPSA